MCAGLTDRLYLPLAEPAELLSEKPEPFIVLFKRGDLSVELFSPRGVDTPTATRAGRVYIGATGTGIFDSAGSACRSARRLLVRPGSGAHAFETVSADFKIWVIFPAEGRLRNGGAALRT